MIVLGSAISLAYYLRVVAAVWMRAPDEAAARRVAAGRAARPAIAGGSAEADADPDAVAAAERLGGSTRRLVQPEVVGLGVVCAAATIFFGIWPSAAARPRAGRRARRSRTCSSAAGRASAAPAYERV